MDMSFLYSYLNFRSNARNDTSHSLYFLAARSPILQQRLLFGVKRKFLLSGFPLLCVSGRLGLVDASLALNNSVSLYGRSITHAVGETGGSQLVNQNVIQEN